MTTNITLGGYDLETLKGIKAAVQQDAAKFVSQELERARELFDQIVEKVDSEEVDIDSIDGYRELEAIAEQATEAFDNVHLIASLGEVTYYLDYHTEWGYSDEQPLTSRLEDIISWHKMDDGFKALHQTLEDMESQSRNWHQSTCY